MRETDRATGQAINHNSSNRFMYLLHGSAPQCLILLMCLESLQFDAGISLQTALLADTNDFLFSSFVPPLCPEWVDEYYSVLPHPSRAVMTTTLNQFEELLCLV